MKNYLLASVTILKHERFLTDIFHLHVNKVFSVVTARYSKLSLKSGNCSMTILAYP